MLARRKKKRSLRVAYQGRAIVTAGSRRFSGTTLDVSTTGMLLYADATVSPKPKEFLQVSFTLPGLRRMVSASAKFVRSASVGGVVVWGIRFVHVPEEAKAAIAKLPRPRSDSDKVFIDVGDDLAPRNPMIPSPLPEE